MIRSFKNLVMPLAMILGAVGYQAVGYIAFLTPYLIFTMLLLTFSRLSPGSFRFSRLHGWLLLIQVGGSALIYGILQFFDSTVAEGVMICVLAPTATSAAVITGMLGGNVAFLTAYTLLSSLCVAVTAPLAFSLLGGEAGMTFWASFLYICKRVVPLLIVPLLAAWTLRYLWPKAHRGLQKISGYSFYIWTLALVVVTGNTVKFLVGQENPRYLVEFSQAGFALLVCAGQFALGRRLGRKYNGDAVSAGQGLGQKNTILAIWMAQTYLNPVSSVAPAAYVLWQNLINTWQLWRCKRTQ